MTTNSNGRFLEMPSRRDVLAAGATFAAAQLIASATVAAQSADTNRTGKDKLRTRKLGGLEVSELGFGFVPWGPVGQGFLSGNMDVNAQSTFDPKTDLRATFPRFSAMVMQNNQPIIEILTTFGAKKGGATPAQIALAWLMAQKLWIVPIPGTGNMDHLRENIGAVRVQLTPADLREIETGFSRIEIYGGRMDARQMAQIGQD